MTELSGHFNLKRLLGFTLPSVIMLIFTSVYGIVDGYFVSNYAGKTPFAAVNFIMPVLMILGCIGFMFGTSGGALIAKTMGEGESKKANEIFTLIVAVSAACGVVLSVLGIIFLPRLAELFGTDGQLLENSVTYGRIILAALPFYILQFEFQCLFATAGKPRLGLIVTAAAGIANMVLDALLVAVFPFGLKGAAAATAISQFLGGTIPLLYFCRKNNSLLRFVKCRFDKKVLLKTCTNGSSELMSNISMSVVSMLYNVQLMKYAGENGIAAYGVLMYVSMIFQAVFIGYAVGSAPIISYNYGAGNKAELKSLLKTSAAFMAVCALITAHAFSIFSFSFLLSGFAIFGSSFFTALNDGFTSAAISFLRTLVFQIAAVLIFPLFFKLDGIWFSIVAAEIMAVCVTLLFLAIKRKKYGY